MPLVFVGFVLVVEVRVVLLVQEQRNTAEVLFRHGENYHQEEVIMKKRSSPVWDCCAFLRETNLLEGAKFVMKYTVLPITSLDPITFGAEYLALDDAAGET